MSLKAAIQSLTDAIRDHAAALRAEETQTVEYKAKEVRLPEFDLSTGLFGPMCPGAVGVEPIINSVSGLASVAVQIMSLVRFNPAVEPLAPLVAA